MLRLLITVLVLWWPLVSWAKCPLPDTRIGVHEFPPWYTRTPAGQIEGELVDLISQLMTGLDCRWTIQLMPVPRLLRSVAEGHIDLTMLIHHPRIETHAYYGKQAIGTVKVMLYRYPDTAPITHLDQLPKGSRVIVRRGYGYNGLINQLMDPQAQIRLLLAESHQQGVELLRDRQGEYLLSYDGPTHLSLQAARLQAITADPIATWPIYLLLSKKIYDGPRILEQLDSEVRKLL